jgi:sugar phosphate isomerase/epimerase
MRLGIIGDWSEEGFRYVQGKGLDCVEFCYNHDQPTDKLLALVPSLNEWQEKYGVKILSMGRWGSKRINDDGTINEPVLKEDYDVIDAASAVGCPVFNCGCNYTESKNYKENCDIAAGYFAKLIEYAKGKNVKIATYNCDWGNFVYNDKAWSAIHSNMPELGIKYDVSHCINRHGDYLKEIRDWGDRFYHFHLKGTLYVDGEHYDDPPAGLDPTDWRSVMALLYIKGYDKMVSIEPHSHNWQGEKGEWGVDFTINFIRPFIKG